MIGLDYDRSRLFTVKISGNELQNQPYYCVESDPRDRVRRICIPFRSDYKYADQSEKHQYDIEIEK